MMSNEELAVRIKAGERDLLLQLWGQVRGVIAWYAVRRYDAAPGLGGCEVEDLIQSGYIAMLEAVETFDPEAGCKFTTWLRFPLKTAFAEAGGYKSERQKRDPLHRCDSLDRPLDDEGGATLGDLQAAPDCYEDAEEQIWREQLRASLDRAMETLPQEWRDTLERRYYQGKSQKETAEVCRVPLREIQSRERCALERLNRESERSGLIRFLEERAVDLKTNWYTHVGVRAFTSTGTSAVEKLVMQRERHGRLDEYIDAVCKDIELDREALRQMQIRERGEELRKNGKGTGCDRPCPVQD